LIPQLHHLLGPLFADAGLPQGVLQILNFSETEVPDRIEQMIAHPDVRMVNFTGSVRLGRILAARCGHHLK
jgi:acyl-CoA reductase-like NAD-dependent aldehyde dehydrogenase